MKKADSAYMMKDTASRIVKSWWNIVWKEDWEREQAQLIWLKTQLSHDAEQLWLTKLCHSWILASVYNTFINAELSNTALLSNQFMSSSFICMKNAAHSSMIKLSNSHFISSTVFSSDQFSSSSFICMSITAHLQSQVVKHCLLIEPISEQTFHSHVNMTHSLMLSCQTLLIHQINSEWTFHSHA